jgi:FkbM family methyltransferase
LRNILKKILNKLLQPINRELLYSVSAAQFLSKNEVELVLDVGANVGQFAHATRISGYNGPLWSFEPVKAIFNKLAHKSRKDAQWKASNFAVGAKEGAATIHVSALSLFSSIKPYTRAATDFDPRSRTAYDEEVRVKTLDGIVDSNTKNIFLKVDTQGFEQEVLAGAADVLKRCVGVQLELSIEHLYEDVWSFGEALAYLETMGFVPAQIRPVNFSRQFPASAVEFDCIFRRAER